jgi:hypothetical protein
MVDPDRAWALFMSDPLDFIAMFVGIALTVVGFACYLRSYRD